MARRQVPTGLPYLFYGVEFIARGSDDGVVSAGSVLDCIGRYLVGNGRGLVHRAAPGFWYADAADGADALLLLLALKDRILEEPGIRGLISEAYWYEPGFVDRVA